MSDKKDQDLETSRTMLQIYHERSNQLANMLIALNGFMLAFIGGLIMFVRSTYFSAPACVINCPSCAATCTPYNPQGAWAVIIAINIAIIVMILWRFYAHYIDDDIVNCYRKILFFEHELNVPSQVSLLNSLEKFNPEKIIKYSPGLMKSTRYQNIQPRWFGDDSRFWQKIRVIDQLIESKKFGNRGQQIFDIIVMILIGIFFTILFFFFYTIITKDNALILLHFITVFVYIITLIVLFLNPKSIAKVHRDPTKQEIDKIVDSVERGSQSGEK